MGYARIKIKKVVSQDDLQRWEDKMLEKAIQEVGGIDLFMAISLSTSLLAGESLCGG